VCAYLGVTGSGKSTLARKQLELYDRLIVVLPEWDPAFERFGDVARTLAEIVELTSQPTFRVLYVTEEQLEFQYICHLAWQRGNLCLAVDEIHEYVPSTFLSIPRPFKRIVLRGGKRNLSVVGISQRPANMHKDLLSQAAALQLYVFKLGWADDFKALKQTIPDVERVRNFKVGQYISWPAESTEAA
jgi:hypothetical protein